MCCAAYDLPMGNTPWGEGEGPGSGPGKRGGYDPYAEAEGRSLFEPPNPYPPAEDEPFGSSPRQGQGPSTTSGAPAQAPAGYSQPAGYPAPGSAPANPQGFSQQPGYQAGFQQPGYQPGYQQGGYQQPGYQQPGSQQQPIYQPGWQPGGPNAGQRPPRRGRGLIIGAATVVVAIAVGLGIYSAATPSDSPSPTAVPTSGGPTSGGSTLTPSLPSTAQPAPPSTGEIPIVWSYAIEDMYPGIGSIAGGEREGNAAYITPDVIIGRFVEDSSENVGMAQLVGVDAVTGDLEWSYALNEARCAPPVEGFGGVPGLSLVCAGMFEDEARVQVLDVASGEIKQEWSAPMDQVDIIHATPTAVLLITKPDIRSGAARMGWFSPQGDEAWTVELDSLLEAGKYTLDMPDGQMWYETSAHTLDEGHLVVHVNGGPSALLLTESSQEVFTDCQDLFTDGDRFFCGHRRAVVARDASGEELWTAQDASFLMDYTRNGAVLMVSDDPYDTSIDVRGLNPDTGEVVGETATLPNADYGIMTGSAELGIVHGGTTLAAFSPEGPRLLWTITLPGDYQREAYPVGDVVLLDGGSSGVYVIDAVTGEIRVTWDGSDWIVGPWQDQVVTVGYFDGLSMRTTE